MWWREYIGVPFVEKGRTPQEGFDCWGLVRWAYHKHHPTGVLLPSYTEHYEKTDDRDALGILIADESKKVWQPVRDQLETLDILILRMRGVPMHVGLVTKPGYMLHCARGVGTVMERYETSKWRSNIEGVVRYVGEGINHDRPEARG